MEAYSCNLGNGTNRGKLWEGIFVDGKKFVYEAGEAGYKFLLALFTGSGKVQTEWNIITGTLNKDRASLKDKELYSGIWRRPSVEKFDEGADPHTLPGESY